MKPNYLFLGIFLHILPGLYAADNLRMGDMRSIAMGGATSAMFNPAMIALREERSIRINYFNRYAMKELATINGSIYLPDNTLSTGVDISSFGYDAYRENLFRLLTAKRLNERWTVGVSIQYALLQTELFEEQPAQLAADAGVTFAPVDNLLTTLSIINFPSASFGHEGLQRMEFMYYMIQAGFQWEVINSMFISATLSTGEDNGAGGSMGIEYVAFDAFSIRAGVKTSPMLPSFGCGYRFAGFSADVAAVYHPVLGVSAGLGVVFFF
jgi:hypothetical protein